MPPVNLYSIIGRSFLWGGIIFLSKRQAKSSPDNLSRTIYCKTLGESRPSFALTIPPGLSKNLTIVSLTTLNGRGELHRYDVLREGQQNPVNQNQLRLFISTLFTADSGG